jgi:hypothetical protein
MEYLKRNSVADEFEVNKSKKFIWGLSDGVYRLNLKS